MLCQVGFESFRKLAPCQHYAPSTAFAFEPDIRAETRDDPFVGATWMLLSEAEMVIGV